MATKKKNSKGNLITSFEIEFYENGVEVSIFNFERLTETLIDMAPTHVSRALQNKRMERVREQRDIERKEKEARLEAEREAEQEQKELEDA